MIKTLPGRPLDGGTVIASVVINDTDHDDTSVLALLLMPETGWHYRLVEVWDASQEVTMRLAFENIVPAFEAYVDYGGDY